MDKSKLSGEFVFEPAETAPVGSVLYREHLKLTDKSHIAAFADFLMPLWYSSISAEHRAVRQEAGLFDCTHMGVLEINGPKAAGFLNLITTNEITPASSVRSPADNKQGLAVGGAQYSYILDAAGSVLDDVIIYRLVEDKFMIVVNAANEPKIKAYLKALQNDQLIIDADNPDRKLEYKPEIRDMRDCKAGCDCRVDIALQGPAAMNTLFALTQDKKPRERIENLKPFEFTKVAIEGIDCIISRTGYTGAKIGFELFVHPENTPRLWNKLLQNGKSLGLIPCGLGARDSLRTEAGLPLYGHELAGPFNISPFEAGYAWAVNLEKKFFIGKAAMQARAKTYDMQVVRVELPGTKGIRPVRQNDGVLNKHGRCVGWVLSCAKAEQKQFALALVNKEKVKQNDLVGIYYLARSQSQIQRGKKQNLRRGQNLDPDIVGTVLSRFAKF